MSDELEFTVEMYSVETIKELIPTIVHIAENLKDRILDDGMFGLVDNREDCQRFYEFASAIWKEAMQIQQGFDSLTNDAWKADVFSKDELQLLRVPTPGRGRKPLTTAERAEAAKKAAREKMGR
jgi:hypothetical protein